MQQNEKEEEKLKQTKSVHTYFDEMHKAHWNI